MASSKALRQPNPVRRKPVLTANREGHTHLLGEVTGSVGGVQDFIVEDGEVEGQAQADGVCGRQVSVGNRGGR